MEIREKPGLLRTLGKFGSWAKGCLGKPWHPCSISQVPVTCCQPYRSISRSISRHSALNIIFIPFAFHLLVEITIWFAGLRNVGPQ